MASPQKWLREVQALIDEEGWPMEIEPTSRGKHLGVVVRASDGRTQRVTMARTPSDHRSIKNARTRLRNTLRALEERI